MGEGSMTKADLGRWYVDNTSTEDTVNVRLRPEHWRTHDFAKAL